jgi:hypothetical protein
MKGACSPCVAFLLTELTINVQQMAQITLDAYKITWTYKLAEESFAL